MFGREPHLPIDVALGVNSATSGSGSYPAYIANLRDRLSLAYQKVIEESMKSAAHSKQSYDSRAHQATIQVGDLVLVRNLTGVADFRPPHFEMPAAVENLEANSDEMENPMQTDSKQVHPDPVAAGTDQQCDAGYPAIPNSVFPISDSDERPTEVTHSARGPDVAEADPIQEPPYLTRSGRTSKPPQRLICDPVWTQKASVLLYLANSQNQELLQNVFQNWLNC